MGDEEQEPVYDFSKLPEVMTPAEKQAQKGGTLTDAQAAAIAERVRKK